MRQAGTGNGAAPCTLPVRGHIVHEKHCIRIYFNVIVILYIVIFLCWSLFFDSTRAVSPTEGKNVQ